MVALVDKGMRDGAWGMCTGLIYLPSSYASTDELVKLAERVSMHGGIYASHIATSKAGRRIRSRPWQPGNSPEETWGVIQKRVTGVRLFAWHLMTWLRFSCWFPASVMASPDHAGQIHNGRRLEGSRTTQAGIPGPCRKPLPRSSARSP